MISTNSEVIIFLEKNIILIVLLVISILKIVPPEWAGFWKFTNNKESDGKAPRITILNLVLVNFFDSIVRSFFIPLLAAFGLKNMVTLVILIVVVFDIFFRNQISTAAVTLTSVGIIALYLESLIETGKHIKLFGGLLTWEKEDSKITPFVETLKKNKK